MVGEKVKEPSVFSLKSPWDEHAHKVWLASTLTLSRNFSTFNFPHKLDKAQEDQIINLTQEAMHSSPLLQVPTLFRSEKITPLEKEFLLEHFLLFNGFHQAYRGEGFFIDESSTFLAIVNVKDHLQLTVLDTQQEIEKSWNRLTKIETEIGKKINFSYNDRFGFLTSDPKISGTALQVTLYLHIPAIIHSGELPDLLEREKEDEVNPTGLQGNISEMIGDILVAKNICTLGLTEEYILTMMRMWATRAVIAEISMRKQLMTNNNEKIKNKVTRALGLLTHTYQLETIEALNALSLVKLGIDIGWILAPDTLNVNQLFFDCRRAHLLHIIGKETSIAELPLQRAKYLHSITEKLTLTI